MTRASVCFASEAAEEAAGEGAAIIILALGLSAIIYAMYVWLDEDHE
jgi:hypothetical protein